MGRIRILPDVVANKIAAGEVVERPASVVKELLENSLDAGATDIRVDIENGGRRLIRIADNGSGLMRDDAMLAFERHATSKLSDVKDLLRIATLGFRGEALPSIASVSRLSLETRAKEEQTGTLVEVVGGKMIKCDEFAFAGGTIITVRDLFFNVPARKKFLRTEQTELAHVAALVTHYSLAHPDKTFELRNGAQALLHVTPVEGYRERVFQVFGSGVLDDLVELPLQERMLPAMFESEEDAQSSYLRLSGFISRPQVQKLNRNSVYLFVNGRLIRDRLLMHALTGAYHNLVPPGTYPFAVLFLDCDPAEVDVNVHPSKTEVRFRRGTAVHDFVRDALRGLLMESRPAPSFTLPASPPQVGARLPYSEFTQRLEGTEAAPMVSEVQPITEDGEVLPAFTLNAAAPPAPRFDFSAEPAPVTREAPREFRLPVPDTHGPLPAGVDIDHGPVSLEILRDLRPIGQLHDSFIVAAGRDGLWIIDQHVAHERILFEKVLRQSAAGRSEQQRLLMPIVLPLSVSQEIEYARIADELARTGFETEPFGQRTIAVKAAPAGLGLGDIERVLFEILEIAEGELRKASVDDLRRATAATVACHAAIKINMRLDMTKMEYLLRELANTEYPMSCPHGRPIALRYPMRDILRAFHRI